MQQVKRKKFFTRLLRFCNNRPVVRSGRSHAGFDSTTIPRPTRRGKKAVMPNSIARRALASFTGKLLSATAVSTILLLAVPATAQQQEIVSAGGTTVYGPPEQLTVMFSDADALAGLLRRQGVSDAEAAAIENGVRKSMTAAQRKQGAILQLHFAGYYGSRALERVAVEPVSGSGTTLTRTALGLPAASPTVAVASEPAAKTETIAAATPKAEPPKAEAPKVEAPKAETPKAIAAPTDPVAADIAPAPVPAPQPAKLASTGGAAPAVTAKAPSMVGHHSVAPHLGRATGIIAGDVVQAMHTAGVPRHVADEVNSATKLHPALKSASLANSRFEVAYSPSFDAHAGFSLAAFNVDGRDHRIWRFQPDGAPAGLFTDEGERLAGIVLRSPMPGVEINSGFGMRKHPVFRVAKMHWGVDFPAPHGAPIIAAADGVITAAKRYGNYGLYMHIDHGQGVATTYGHMSRFATGMKPGVKVKAGDVIAHIGRTGVATGPHLYFEVVIGERRVDPEPLIAAGATRLVGSDLLAFERIKLQSGVTELASESRN
jgi:murein DD-endopeptidase MepM/ murein hydrolase activator NlpD